MASGNTEEIERKKKVSRHPLSTP
ncbi:MAG: hypothetical protein QOF58_3532, partial [Pseudonocardiales bacterium]|nr:hypothetical protein [Pseudonocardiales bacterium]